MQNKPKGRIAFASDFHLGHNRDFIYQARGFENIQRHDQYILQAINAEIGPQDYLYYLGDFSLNTTVEQTTELFKKIQCNNIFYIWGNHESSTKKIYHEAKRNLFGQNLDDNVEVYPVTFRNVTFLGNMVSTVIRYQRMTLQHYAPLVWDASHHGSWALCGHSHGNCSPILPEATNGKVLDVGVDVAMKHCGRPFFWFEDVVRIMNKKNIGADDHDEPCIDSNQPAAKTDHE